MVADIKLSSTFLNYKIYTVDKIDSTNTFFKNNFSSYEDNSVLVANHQTAGRGRYIRTWINENDLCFSLLTYQINHYEILTPLAVMNALRKLSIQAFIKWPNDIYVDDKKICGILIEDLYKGNQFVTSVIGIGINLYDKESVNGVGVTSYFSISKEDLLLLVLQELDSLLKKPIESVLNEYEKNNLIYHRNILFHSDEYQVTGFTKEGYLRCLSSTGSEVIISSDEIDIKKSLK